VTAGKKMHDEVVLKSSQVTQCTQESDSYEPAFADAPHGDGTFSYKGRCGKQ